ncbi:MAG: ORF6N domain-containing protein, partial [Phycisphaerae bacterium]
QAEFQNLKSQFVTSSSDWGGRRKRPYVFTEHGAVMAAAVLNSKKAVQMSVYVVRAFIKLRQMLAPFKEIQKRLARLEQKFQSHDDQIITLIQAIRLLMPPSGEKPKEPFGFRSKKKTSK